MALLSIIVAPDLRLKVTTEPVEDVDDDLRTFLDDMLETMYAAAGIGLAAPQVGDTRSVVVVDVGRKEDDPMPVKMINPQIVWHSEDECPHE